MRNPRARNCRSALADALLIGQAERMAIDRREMALPVRLGTGEIETWILRLERDPHVSCAMRLEAPDGRSWSAAVGTALHCLFAIRNQVEPEGIRLCCNGARRDAWVSGMLGDMGDGLEVYLMDTRTPDGSEPFATVGTLGAAPPDEVVSVAEQIDHLAAMNLWGFKRPTWVYDLQ